MFAKQLLSVIGVLFTVVHAADVCKIKLTSGGCSTDEDAVDPSDALVCTNGYYAVFPSGKDNSKFYLNDEEVETGDTKGSGKLVLISEGPSCALKENDTGFFVSAETGKYIKNTGKVATMAGYDGSSCTAGQFTTGGNLCLDSNQSHAAELNSGKNYLFADADNMFGSGVNAEVVISSAAESNAFTQVSTFSTDTDYEYCVSSEKLIQERGDNWCSSDDCSYYKCSDGKCVDIRAQTPDTCDPSNPSSDVCNNGYYLYHSTNGLANADNFSGTLYLCSESGTICKIVGETNDEAYTKTPIPTGYLINADSDNFATVPFIKCTGGACTGVELGEGKSIDEAANCGSLNIGDLYYTTVTTTTTYYICLATVDGDDNPVNGIPIASITSGTVTPNDDKKFFISIAQANANVFGSTDDEFNIVGINLNSGSITLNTEQETTVRYKYTDATFEIQDRKSNAICNAGQPKAGIQEFIKKDDGEIDYYKDNTANMSPA